MPPVAVLSPAYLADRWAVFGEQLASHLGVDDTRIIPLRLTACDLPLRLDARVLLDFTDGARWDALPGVACQRGQWLRRQTARYGAGSFNPFVRAENDGGWYSLERNVGYSVVNTATLLRFHRHHATTLPTLDVATAEAKLKTDLNAEVLNLAAKLAQPEDAEYIAYRVAQILRAIDDARAQAALRDWLLAYLQRWVMRQSEYEPNVFVVYLAIERVGSGIEREGVVPAALELLLARQVILARETNGNCDGVDLALLVAMIDRSQVAIDQMNAAVDVLNAAAVARRIWTNRRPVTRIGDKTIGCSAFEACVALLQPVSAWLYGRLRAAFVSHLEWITDQVAKDGLWYRSDLLRNKRVHESWFNCLIVEFFTRLNAQADGAVVDELLTRYRARVPTTSLHWGDMILAPDARDAMRAAFIDPAKAPEPRFDQCTAILFGPPGTTKTTIVETMAAEIGWPLIELGVSDFLARGIDRVFECSTEIFEDLLHARRAVVLLDEVENVFADRQNHEAALLQKLLTAALLPPLQRLQKRRAIILLIATNHIDTFDTAVSRPGRIDLIVPVGPPDREQRARLLERSVGLDPVTADELATLLRDGTTLQELLLFKKLAVPPGKAPGAEAATALNALWKESSWTPAIDDKLLEKFNDEARKYRRLR
jgi:ATPase family associated with various cellular activities (AAA)